MAYWINLALIFFSYAFFGWCTEVTLKFIQYHRFINRGFLTGPICPIYGTGAVLITLAMDLLPSAEHAVGTTFAVSFLLCGLVEYFTSYFMEKRFHARWWDYSRKPMNLNGRVWIGNLVLFGLGGVAIVHLINPWLYALLGGIGLRARGIAACCLLAVTAADYTVSHFVLRLVKTSVEHSEADNTEAINREVRLMLRDRNIFYRRFADAYPEVIYRTKRINERLAAIREETERLRRRAEDLLDERKAQLAESIEPSASIRSRIIDSQSELIDRLYDAQTAPEELKTLKAEIDRQKQRLARRPLSVVMKRRNR